MRKKVISIAEGLWKSGAFVPASGIYAVRHRQHLLPSEVTLLEGEVFPRCEACTSEVAFRLQRKLVDSGFSTSFRVQLYQLPVLEENERRRTG